MLEELPVFVDEPAEYESRDDHIVSRWKGREFVMPIEIARQAELRLREAIAKWHLSRLDRGAVVQLSPRA